MQGKPQSLPFSGEKCSSCIDINCGPQPILKNCFDKKYGLMEQLRQPVHFIWLVSINEATTIELCWEFPHKIHVIPWTSLWIQGYFQVLLFNPGVKSVCYQRMEAHVTRMSQGLQKLGFSLGVYGELCTLTPQECSYLCISAIVWAWQGMQWMLDNARTSIIFSRWKHRLRLTDSSRTLKNWHGQIIYLSSALPPPPSFPSFLPSITNSLNK